MQQRVRILSAQRSVPDDTRPAVLSLTHSLAILSPYSSYCACDHSPWVFALPGLIILLPVITFCLLLHGSRLPCCNVTLLCSRPAPLADLEPLLAMSRPHFLLASSPICSPLFIFLLSPADAQIYPLTPPPLLEMSPHTPVFVLLSKSLGSSSTIVWFVGPSQLRFGFLP